ncbi:MAG TPA: ADP-ribosylglycohydrolase family protein, partial [Gemmatimonadaceae bacterium]|nr:ADP-ribosylglycohydrolase family protein [Gemmatimonadaceae bacterium]
AIAVACALAHPDDFAEATCLAANLVRGDSDSTASMTGQLVGLQVGLEGLPSEWLASLELRDVIAQVADDLAIGWRPGRAWQARWPGGA